MIKPEERMQELAGLIELAEKSTLSIDMLAEKITKEKIQRMTQLAALLFFVVVFLAFYLFAMTRLDSKYSEVVQIVLAVLASLVSIASFFNFQARSMRSSSLKHDLYIEREVQSRLVSIINDQINRVQRAGEISEINAVMLEIRLKRLERSYEY